MVLKGTIAANHIPINKYTLSITDVASIVFTKVSGIEQEVAGTILPDRTRASGGEPQPFEMTCEVPLHHTTEVALLENWFAGCKDPVATDYRKTGTLAYLNTAGSTVKSYTLDDMWITKMKYPDTDMSNEEGEMAVLEVTFSVDSYSVV